MPAAPLPQLPDALPAPPRRFGLVAHKRHLQPGGGLTRWLDASAGQIRAMGIGLHAVGGTFDALERDGRLAGYAPLRRLPYGRDGGLMRMVSHIAGGADPSDALDGVIYLMDPVDPSSIYPEAQALKRQCVTHGKPFVATIAGAVEWIVVESITAARAAGGTGNAGAAVLPSNAQQTVALIAHDALKDRMSAFAERHFDLLSGFAERIATGTTGSRLNDMAWRQGWPQDQPWVRRYLSGPLGGDAQIAERVLDRRCHKVIFFEDPHVARQHEADIQLLERAVCSASAETTCFNSPVMAELWAEAQRR
ncbi:MAG: methylglyoxal synthase [Polaromonas sp.]|nr:methylglyoxal synthase [Polaromonas sp.]